MPLCVDLGGRRIIKKINIFKIKLIKAVNGLNGLNVLIEHPTNLTNSRHHIRQHNCVSLTTIYILPRNILVVFQSHPFFKQKTAYEMESRDWSSDVCSSD
eukprot:COSAG02_NODE_49571_length_326_cov_0.643172_1_plen_99_part_10